MDMKLDGGDASSNGEVNLKKVNKKRNTIIASVIVGIILLICIARGVYIHSTVSKYDNLIMPGISIDGIDVGNMSMEEAKNELHKKYTDELSNRLVSITVGDNNYNINYDDLDVHFNIDETVDEAFSVNRDLKTLKKFKAIKNPEVKELNISFTYNDEAINSMVSNIESEVNVEKKDATITKSGSGFSVTDHVVGRKLDTEALLDEINAKVKDSKEGNIEVEGVITEEVPVRNKEALSAVNTMISTASTKYGTSDPSRGTNISIGARTLNGIVLMPGESFSFNTVVGDTTPDKGYQEGGVYVGDKLEKGYGGGICQVSSTLHNAVLKTGILPDQRTNHSMPVGYVDFGLDATIAYGYLDYVFTNSYDYPIYIEGYAGGGTLTFNIYSNSSVNAGKTYGFVSDVYETVPLAVKYEDDPSLEQGKEVVKQNGSTGYKVKAYRITYTNGVETNRELLNNDTYASLPRIVRRGTKPVVKTEPETQPETPAP